MNFLSKDYQEVADEKESADYLFHYTSGIDHLASIMNNYFMPFYCMESIEYLNLPESNIEGMAYPLVCFCDLPLSRQKKHKGKFGEYGIGMNKEWGIKNLLTPVIYSHPRSITSVSLNILINIGESVKKNLPDDFNKFRNSVSLLLMHFKSYEGKQYNKQSKSFVGEPTRFYNEREWRYIPLNIDGLKLHLEMDEYQNNVILDIENKLIQKNNRLKFNLNDVEFLFLKDKAEIDLFISKISPKYSEDDKKEIRSKIRVN